MISGDRHAGQSTALLQKRIVAFALIAVLLTGVAVALATAIPSYNSAKAEEESSAGFQLRLQALALNQHLIRLGDTAMQITSRSVIRDKLEQYHRGAVTLSDLETFTANKLADAMKQHSQSVGITRLDAGGKPVVSVGIPVPISSFPHSSDALLYEMVQIEGRLYLAVGAPIVSSRGERLGTDLVLFRTDELASILRGLEELRGATQAYLTRTGVEASWTTGEAREVLRTHPIPESLTPAFSAALGGQHGVQRGTDHRIIVYAPVMDDWAIAVVIEAPELYAPALKGVIIPALTVIGMLLLALVGTRRLLRPLAKESVQLAMRMRQTADEQRALLEYARGFLYRINHQGEIDFISPSVHEVLGSTPAELPHETVQLLAGEQKFASGDQTGELPSRLIRVTDSSGKIVILEINARVFRDQKGLGLFGVARNVTQRVCAEEAMRSGEERLRTLINAGPDFICFKDGAGRWMEANRAALRLFHLSQESYRGHTDEELAAANDPSYRETLRRMMQGDQHAWESGSATRMEESVPGASGERAFDLIRVPLFDAEGNRSGMVVLGRDVTERRQVERELAQATAEWTYAMDFLDDAICLIDSDDHVVRANRAFYVLTGLTSVQVLGVDVSRVMHPRENEEFCPVCQARKECRDVVVTLEADHPHNPTSRPVEVMVKIIADENGASARLLMGIHDLTRLRHTDEQLRLAATVFEGTHEGIVITDSAHRVLRVNEAFNHVAGFSTEEAAGHKVEDFLRATPEGEAKDDAIWDTVTQYGLWQGESWCRRKSGATFPAWHRISALRDGRGEVLHYIHLITDVTDKKLSEERIHHLAHYDGLTDLPNRLLFNERLIHSMERASRNDAKVALLFLDLDRFKNVNDTLGHQTGDSMLQVIAERLRRIVRAQDTLGRLGGDEFTVVIEDLGRLEDAGAVAHKLLQAIAQPVIIGNHELFVGASIGISLFPDDGRDVQTLLRNADAAMYRAKAQGRNTYQFYTPDLTCASLERLALENSLRRALERNELRLVYQPLVDAASGRVMGAEALLRWQHPAKGLVPPDIFIPLAEETGDIAAIGAWVMETACAQLQAWRRQGLVLGRVAVNLSGQQIVRGNLVETVRGILARTGAMPRDLELEITEGFVMSHLDEGLQVLNELRNLGVKLAIDDFGTGYSSLAYLKRLPINRLKIDRSFVQHIPDDKDDMAIASTIIAMAHTLDLQVIAEGVEEISQLDFLRHQLCDEVQGFLLGEPLTAEEFFTRSRVARESLNGSPIKPQQPLQ